MCSKHEGEDIQSTCICVLALACTCTSYMTYFNSFCRYVYLCHVHVHGYVCMSLCMGVYPYSYNTAQTALKPSDLSCRYIAHHALVIGTVVATVMYAPLPLHSVVLCCSMVSWERSCIVTGLINKQGRIATGPINKQGRVYPCTAHRRCLLQVWAYGGSMYWASFAQHWLPQDSGCQQPIQSVLASRCLQGPFAGALHPCLYMVGPGGWALTSDEQQGCLHPGEVPPLPPSLPSVLLLGTEASVATTPSATLLYLHLHAASGCAAVTCCTSKSE